MFWVLIALMFLISLPLKDVTGACKLDYNYAYQMVNVIKEWMNDEFNKLEINNKESDFKLKKVKANSPMLSFVKNKIFGKFILNKNIMRLFIICKGLTKQETENYST